MDVQTHELAENLGLKKTGRGWRGECPVHGGSSFTLNEINGRPVWKCWTGCTQSDVLIELRRRGLWPEYQRREWTAKQKRDYAKARLEAARVARLASVWISQRLFELEVQKHAAIYAHGGHWDIESLAGAAAEHYRLSCLTPLEIVAEWQSFPIPQRTRIENNGFAWRSLCAAIVRRCLNEVR